MASNSFGQGGGQEHTAFGRCVRSDGHEVVKEIAHEPALPGID